MIKEILGTMIAFYMAFSLVLIVIGLLDGYDRGKFCYSSESRFSYIIQHTLPAYKLGCWLSQPLSKGTL
jgi:hypothetical protein